MAKSTEEFMEDAKQFYFNAALARDEPILGALSAFAKEGHILCGSDFPYAPEEGIERMDRGQKGVMGMKIEKRGEGVEREEWTWGNAMRLFPRVRVLMPDYLRIVS